MGNTLLELRYKALELSLKHGACLSHRLEEIRFDEPGTLLLPDMKSEPDSGFSVGEMVNVDRCRMLPWHALAPYQVDKYGVDTLTYQENAFQILCFAQVTAKKGRCKLVGNFCILADWGNPYPLYKEPRFLWNEGKMLLHWSGALMRPEKPIHLPQ